MLVQALQAAAEEELGQQRALLEAAQSECSKRAARLADKELQLHEQESEFSDKVRRTLASSRDSSRPWITWQQLHC